MAAKPQQARRGAPPPNPAGGAVIPPDPSVPYKDAAFAVLSHEPPLASDDKTKRELVAALTQWVQTNFESRIDNGAQQFGVEQIMRFLGAPSVKSLPGVISETSSKVDRACGLIADIGDDETKKRASEALVALARRIESNDWLNKQRALVIEANQKTKVNATAKDVNYQLTQYQQNELESVFTNTKRLGRAPTPERCRPYAPDQI